MDEESYLAGYDPRRYPAVAVTVDVVALTIRDGKLCVLLVERGAQPYAEACELLRDKTGETGMCGRVEAGVVKVLAFAEGTHPLRYVENVGNKIALHVSALGKAALSLGTPEEAARQLRLKPLKLIAPGSITDLAVLEAQVEQARQQGWMWVENEGVDGLAAIAVAGYLGDEPLALSIAGPTERLRRTQEACLQALKEVQALVFHPQSTTAPVRATASGRRGAGTKDTAPA